MAISTKTRVMLWGRSANRCNHPDCKIELVYDETHTDDPSLIGEVSHIVADKVDGPRGVSPLTTEQRDLYSNLILLCRIHHKVVDDHPDQYTVENLTAMKVNHETWVNESLKTYDKQKQHDHEVYASYIDEWTKLVVLNDWPAWSSYALGSGQPHILKKDYQSFVEAAEWLFNRIWPKRYPLLEEAFENFRCVLSDFLKVFSSQSEDVGDFFYTKKFYKNVRGQEEYDRLAREFDFHVDLVMDLTLELTRSANFVCDRVRELIDPKFRISEGVVIATFGPSAGDGGLTFRRHRVEYINEERSAKPYMGLKQFMTARKSRDFYFGVGTSIDDPACEIAGE